MSRSVLLALLLRAAAACGRNDGKEIALADTLQVA